MKIRILFIVYLLAIFNLLNAQGIWTQKADIGIQRQGAVNFTIGTKCYILTGRNTLSVSVLKDFWEWDQNTNVWIQKADFPGIARDYATSFSIGTKGYIGVGYDGNQCLQDFWEWDQTTDIWIQKANFPGVARGHSSGFSIGLKGYIGTGWNDNDGTELKDFWEWDQNTNVWTQKANFGGTARQGAIGFSIGTKGYIGTGEDQFSPYGSYPSTQDFWEWDQSTDSWTQRSSFPGMGRYHAVGFSIGNKGYVGLGKDYNGGPSFFSDFWEWNQSNDQWTQKADPGCELRWLAVGFSIGNKGYVGFGGGYSESCDIMLKDFWEFDPCEITVIDKIQVNDQISIYPNPNNGAFIISAPDFTKKTELEIYNELGEKVYITNLMNNRTEIVLKEKKGIYFNRIISGNKLISSAKIVIE